MHLSRLFLVAGLAAASVLMVVAGPSLAAVEASPAIVEPIDCTVAAGLVVEAKPVLFVEAIDVAQCDRELMAATGLCLAPVEPARVAFAFVPPEASTSMPSCSLSRSPPG